MIYFEEDPTNGRVTCFKKYPDKTVKILASCTQYPHSSNNWQIPSEKMNAFSKIILSTQISLAYNATKNLALMDDVLNNYVDKLSTKEETL